MKYHHLVLGGLFVALPFIVLAFLTREVGAFEEPCLESTIVTQAAKYRGNQPNIGIKEIYDLPYYEGVDADGSRHGLNLFIPENIENPPLLLWIHGGAWAFGGRAQETSLARKFAKAGIAVAAISYRLSPATCGNNHRTTGIQHPEHIKDVARSFSWLYEHAPLYGYDKYSIFVGGYSAGAHLSALLALDPRYLEAEGRSVQDIKGAIPIAGAYDMVSYYRSQLRFHGKEFADKHVKGVFGDKVDGLKMASPSNYVENKWVPMLVISENETYDYTRLFEASAAAFQNRNIKFTQADERDHAGLHSELSKAENSTIRDQISSYILENRSQYHFIKRPNAMLAYRTFGKGKPLFVLNGGPGYASHHFDRLATELGEKYRVVLFDQRGTGYSEVEELDSESITLEKMIGDLEALRQFLGYEKINILGHSFGGMYASLYAAAHPGRVEKMILSHSGGLTLEFTKDIGERLNGKLRPEERRILRSIPFASTNMIDRKIRIRALAPAYVARRDHAQEIYEGLVFRGKFNPKTNTLVYQDLRRNDYDVSRAMARFKAPVLILHGLQDLINPQIARDTYSLMPNARLVLLDSGHYGWVEQPEQYFAEVENFLDS